MMIDLVVENEMIAAKVEDVDDPVVGVGVSLQNLAVADVDATTLSRYGDLGALQRRDLPHAQDIR